MSSFSSRCLLAHISPPRNLEGHNIFLGRHRGHRTGEGRPICCRHTNPHSEFSERPDGSWRQSGHSGVASSRRCLRAIRRRGGKSESARCGDDAGGGRARRDSRGGRRRAHEVNARRRPAPTLPLQQIERGRTYKSDLQTQGDAGESQIDVAQASGSVVRAGCARWGQK